MVMYDNEFKTTGNKIRTKDKIEPQHIYEHLKSSQIFHWKPCQTLFLSLWPEEDSAPHKQDEWTTASLSLAERWTITEIRRQSNSV